MAELTAQHFKGAAPVLPSGFAGVFAVFDYIIISIFALFLS